MLPPAPFPPTAASAQDDPLTTALAAALDAVVAVATATATSTMTVEPPTGSPPAGGNPGGPAEKPGECRLLGSFALLVQAALGGLALLSLVYKRYRERPQRPVKIWFFDASKQVFGSVLVHIANVFMSMLTSGRLSIMDPAPPHKAFAMMLARGEPYIPNPCSFYLLNLGIDTTLGIPILIALLHLTTLLASYTPMGQPPESIQSGYYGHPPNAWWWLKQSFIYFCGLFGMKIVVLIIFLVFPWISQVGDWALGWTEGNERLQIVFVMMLFPLIMNALQYYIIDSFIKKQTDHERIYDDGDDAAGRGSGRGAGGSGGRVGGYGPPGSNSASDSGDESDTDLRMQRSTLAGRARRAEYDPHMDGDSQTVMGSSRSKPGELISKDLYPHE